jgi:hypothetical protein
MKVKSKAGRPPKAAKKEVEPEPEPEDEDDKEDWEKDEDDADEDEIPSDTDLAAKVADHAKATGNKTAIKKLIASMSETEKVAGVPNDKRAVFLQKLAKIKKPE